MLIAQISDPHVAEPGDPVRAFVDTNANLADEFGDRQLAVEYMRARPALPK